MEDRENEKGSDKQQKVQFDSNLNQTHLPDRDAASASASSHTSDSSLESTLTDKDDGDFLPTSHHPSLDLDSSVSPCSDILSDVSAAQPVSGMPAGYDPNRIPSSIFNSRSTTGMDWSVASNESLFSIHMGNNSFSRDQAFLLYRSGELMKLDEVFTVPCALPPVSEGSGAEWSSVSSRMDMRKLEKPDKTEGVVSLGNLSTQPGPQNSPTLGSPLAGSEFCTPKASPSEASCRNTKPAESPKFEDDKGRVLHLTPSNSEDARNSISLSTISDGSGTSTGSFAFPIFGAGDLKNGSKKLESPKGQPSTDQLQGQKPQPPTQDRSKQNKGGMGNWFSCFSCCSFRCSLSLK
ncbi:uncharacterized protein LOC116207431 [Punica granatum]|uniref:Uncharacterized protein n=2 Tax=Punica granatum TaxID=22663 RepID=A0A218VVE1_PUNGR|nr:uncharacterized protein LOC116207431 [Punica granatum]OWM64524.1 hypothetical protein CDL15_Pgr020491 [Punica granatum]PKI32963.1 hypothetical protein CRG98_046637 [Punica granatum]